MNNAVPSGWTPPPLEKIAQLLPGYEILELVAQGGMGAVYQARQSDPERMVAIKLLPLEVSADQEFADRFQREASTMTQMNHPKIVRGFDFGVTSEGHLFFIMEFVEGTTLHHLIKSTGLKPAHALEIISGVCEALHYAHGQGVVHRDVKPANVLVDVNGQVKVTDFGLARLYDPQLAELPGYTMPGTVLGTPDYMAPEQTSGQTVDQRADIYSLGVLLYEALCGQVPQGVFDPPSRLVRVDKAADQIVRRAMQQDPDRRYQSAAEMQRAVEMIRRKSVPIPPPPPRVVKRKIAPPLGIALAAGVIVAILFWRSCSTPTATPKLPLPTNAISE